MLRSDSRKLVLSFNQKNYFIYIQIILHIYNYLILCLNLFLPSYFRFSFITLFCVFLLFTRLIIFLLSFSLYWFGSQTFHFYSFWSYHNIFEHWRLSKKLIDILSFSDQYRYFNAIITIPSTLKKNNSLTSFYTPPLIIIIIIIIVFILRDGGVTQMSLNKCRQVVVLGGLALTVIIIILIGTLIIRKQVLPK